MQDTQGMRVLSLSWEDPLEEEMATSSSVLAWEIPWTEGPGGLQSMGLHRGGHDWVHTHTYSTAWWDKSMSLPRSPAVFSWGHVSFLPLCSHLGPSYFDGILKTGWRSEWGSDGVWLLFTKSSLEMDLQPLHPGVKRNHLRNPTEVDYV